MALAVRILIAAALPAYAKPTSNPPPPNQDPIMITFINPDLPLSAQVVRLAVHFNPKELSTTKVAPWGHAKRENDSSPKLEYTHGTPYSMSLELMFDGFENQTDLRPLFEALLKFVASPGEKKHPRSSQSIGGACP